MNAPGTNLATRQNSIPALAMDETELMGVLRTSLYPGAQDNSIKMVINWCRAQNKDPMKKPVHIVPMRVKDPVTKEYSWRDVLMPGIGDYRTDAARTGEYAGIDDANFGPDVTETLSGVEITYPSWCEVSVFRMVNGQRCAFSSGKVWWRETYATARNDTDAPNTMWKKRPRGQLEKCAEAMALRRAFPEVGAVQTADEMEGRVIEPDFAGATIDGTTGEVTGGIKQPQSRREAAQQQGAGSDRKDPPSAPPPQTPPPASSGGEPLATVGAIAFLRKKIAAAGKTEADVCEKHGITTLDGITEATWSDIKQALGV